MKEKKKPSIILYTEHLLYARELPLEDRGRLLTALMDFADTRALPDDFTGALSICFNLLLDGVKKHFASYDAKCKKNQACANMRWHNNAEQEDANASDNMQEDANASDNMREDANASDNMHEDANASFRIPENANSKSNSKSNSNSNSNSNPSAPPIPPGADALDYLTCGEDGEPFVIYGKQ